jgi:alkylation response protein AidB-like acyl-CoA dehydrogenase
MYRLTAEQQADVAKAQAIATSTLAAHAAEVDSQSSFPRQSIDALGAAGFLGLLVPTDLGGMGQGVRVLAAVVDELAQHCASTAMIYMMHNAGVSCYLADPAKFATELKDCAAGKHLSTLAFSEKGSRSQFWAPVSQAKAAGQGMASLSAEKSWVTSAGIADGIVASAGSTDGTGASVFLIKKEDAGLTISGGWNSLGMRGNQSNPMTLTDVKIDLAQRLIGTDGQGADIMLGKALPAFQICQGAIGVGIAEAAFQSTLKHVTGNGFQHTSSKLSDLPNQRARIAEMRAEIDKARAYLAATLDKVEAGAADAMLHVLAVKASSGETAVSVTDTAMRACGGAAFSKHLSVERNFRDARAAVVMAPTTDHLREFCGRVLCGMPLFG